MDSDELRKVVKLIDKIILSERKEVQEAFRELLVIVALTADSDFDGPLTALVSGLRKQLDDLEHRVRELERPKVNWGEYSGRDDFKKYFENTWITDHAIPNPGWDQKKDQEEHAKRLREILSLPVTKPKWGIGNIDEDDD